MKDLNWQIVERVKDVLGRGKSTDETQRADPDGTQKAESDGTKVPESDGGTSAALYKCPECETTYISEEMESCPECGGAVDQRPSAAELGIGSNTR